MKHYTIDGSNYHVEKWGLFDFISHKIKIPGKKNFHLFFIVIRFISHLDALSPLFKHTNTLLAEVREARAGPKSLVKL